MMNRRAFMKFVPAASVLFLASDKEEMIVPDEPKRIQFGTESTAGTTVPQCNIKFNMRMNGNLDVDEVAKEVARKIREI